MSTRLPVLRKRDKVLSRIQSWSAILRERVPSILGAYVGGSISSGADVYDDVSDIDLNMYYQSDNPTTLGDVLASWDDALGERTVARERASSIEIHTDVDGIEIDLKIRELSSLSTPAKVEPSLDESYLELLSAVDNYIEVTKPEPICKYAYIESTDAIPRVREKLLVLAKDRYIKMIHSAVKQAVYRQEMLCASTCVNYAMEALTIAHYLKFGLTPPPFKWRASHTELATTPNGMSLLRSIERFHSFNADEVNSQLSVLRSAEVQSGLFDEDWWWQGRIPTTVVETK